jgi:hypothetical protein
MTIARHGKSKLAQAVARGWTPKEHRGPCRYLRERRDEIRLRKKGGRL